MLERARSTSLLPLQRGSAEFLKSHKGQWGIVSVGWSSDFIRAALGVRGIDLKTEKIQIHANEIEFDMQGIGTGKLSKHRGNSEGIRVASDKKRVMEKMTEAWRTTDPTLICSPVIVSSTICFSRLSSMALRSTLATRKQTSFVYWQQTQEL